MRCAMLDRNTIRGVFPKISFEHQWIEYPLTHPENLIERLQNVQVAITNKVIFNKEVLTQLPHLKLIALCATGFNNIDTTACKALGIAVTNVRGYARSTVSEHVFMLMLALTRRLPEYYKDVHLHNTWPLSSLYCDFSYPIGELSGKILGIIGKGNLGQRVAEIALAFGMKVLFAEHKNCSANNVREGYTPFDVLIKESDIISLHCPLNADTYHLIDEEVLKKMSSHTLLINTSRGDLIDEPSLAKALENNWIAGAGLDVLSQEPPSADNPLIQLRHHKRLIVTPHNAWASEPAMQEVCNQVVESIESFKQGEHLRRVV
ncbi:MAG: D-2-hydroxyacid dehydrogenase [Pseudomonadota bacterium]